MDNPLLKTILRCSLGFVLLAFSIVSHSSIYALFALVNFVLAGAWLWIEMQK